MELTIMGLLSDRTGILSILHNTLPSASLGGGHMQKVWAGRQRRKVDDAILIVSGQNKFANHIHHLN